MREIILDTESTGLDPSEGHRLVEIGCVELINYVPTGKTFQVYINPQRDMPADAQMVHGLTDAFLADKPLFTEIVDDFLSFIGDAPLVIHNAEFDMRFLNAELALAGLPQMPLDRAVDTLMIARRKFPGSPASLDALCRRYNIDSSERTVHGALLDAQLLAEVYLELMGGRQHGLILIDEQDGRTDETASSGGASSGSSKGPSRTARPARPHSPTPEEAEAHQALLKELNGNLW